MTAGMKRLRPIIDQQRTRDVSEADTVTLVKDVMADVFGYDKYSELTGEHAIRGTFCDLAVKLDEKCVQIIEVKAIGIELNDRHVKQAIDYAANKGVEWVVLTNAVQWRLYHVIFAKPIDKKLIAELDVTAIDCRREEDLERLYLFTREGFVKGAHEALRDRQDATSRFLVAALLIHNDAVVATLRRELRRMVDVNISEDEILKVMENEVIKRDALEGPPAEEAAARVNKAESRRIIKPTDKPGGTGRSAESATAPTNQDVPASDDMTQAGPATNSAVADQSAPS
jgi:hypothetical protein